MNKNMHYDWSYNFFLHTSFRCLAERIARVCYSVDHEHVGNVSNIIETGRPYPVITQSYDYDWWRTKKWHDSHVEIWTRWHFGGKEALEMGRGCAAGMGRKALEAALAAYRRASAEELPAAATRIGLALHVFQDSFSHAGFYGCRHSANDSDTWYKNILVPSIGHADYGTAPDEIGKVWQRNNIKANNKERFFQMCVELENMMNGEGTTEARDWATGLKPIPQVVPFEPLRCNELDLFRRLARE